MNKQRRRQSHSHTHKAGCLPRYRRSTFLVSYWLGPIHVFENYLEHQKVAGPALISDLLAFCEEPRAFEEVCTKFPELNPRDIQGALRRMEKYSLLESSKEQALKNGDLWRGWKSWSPGASHFHFSTKDVKYARGEAEDFSSLCRLARQKALPARSKKYAGIKRVRLAKPVGNSEFARVLKERRTWRQFSKKSMEFSQLETLLWLSFGVQRWVNIPGVGRLPLKTSPSGGALHPLEAYLFIRNVKGIIPGIYHYDAEGHGLELLRTGAGKIEMKRLLAGQSWYCDSAIVVFLTAVFPRTQWKYEHSRAYRVVLAEAGHVCQTFCLTATWLGLAPFCTMALADSKIEQALGVDGITESVMYAMGAGVRPKRAATPDHLGRGKRVW